MNEVLIGINMLLLFIAIPLVCKLCFFYKQKKIFEQVKWCVYYDSFHKTRPEVRMRDQIFRLQHELSLDPKYRITKGELDAINDILLNFRQDVIQNYFSGSYQKLGFSFETNLIYYLENHENKHEFRNNVTYHKLYYIMQLHHLKLRNIVGNDKLGVITANATKETIDDILSR